MNKVPFYTSEKRQMWFWWWVTCLYFILVMIHHALLHISMPHTLSLHKKKNLSIDLCCPPLPMIKINNKQCCHLVFCNVCLVYCVVMQHFFKYKSIPSSLFCFAVHLICGNWKHIFNTSAYNHSPSVDNIPVTLTKQKYVVYPSSEGN